MPKQPNASQPPFGQSIPATYQTPKATELFADDLVVIHFAVDAPQYQDGTKGDPHPDTTKFPSHTLDTIVYSSDGTVAVWTYVHLRGPIVSTQRTSEGQTATSTETLVAGDADPVDPTALIISATDENLANGNKRRTITTVPDVYPNKSFSAEIPDLIPPEFRDIIPTRTTAFNEEGDAQPPDLGVGELSRREDEVTEQIKRVSVTSRDTTQLPKTLVDQQTSEAFGFGGVMDVERTLDAAPQDVEEGLNVVSSSVKNLGSGLTLKETEKLAASTGTLELTNGGSGFTSDPTVSFSGGDAAGGAVATASVSPITTAPTSTVIRKYAFNGDDQGVFYYLATLGNNGVWRNPQTNGDIVISAPFDTLDQGTFDEVVDREKSNVYLVERDGAELHFDLKAGRTLLCDHLTYQQRSDYGSACRELTLQGSNDNSTWHEAQTFDFSGTDPGIWKQIKITHTVAYRYFRLILTTGDTFLSIGEFELYGTLSLVGEVTGGAVTAVEISDPGEYLSAPTVVFTGGGGSGASAEAILTGTLLTRVDILNPGTGYATAPTISFTGGVGDSDPATATATIGKGVSSVSVSPGGSGYTSPPAVSFTDPDGSGAAAYATLGFGVTSIPVSNGGSGYTSNPTVAVTGSGGSGVTAAAHRAFTIASVTVTTAGSGYTSDPIVTASGGGGADASFLVLRGLPLASISVTAPGAGYTSAPTVGITGGGGTGATGTAVLGYQVDSITVTSDGTGYSSAPTVAISGGSGNGATAVATLEGRAVDSIAVTAGGSYPSKPTVTVQGDGSGATAAAHMGVAGSPTITAAGTGYMANDVLTIVGGTGTAATFKVLTVGGGGDVLTFSILTPGDYTVLPTSPVSVTGGAGTGATFTIAAWTIVSIAVTAGGSGYVAVPTTLISGAGGGAATVILSANATIKITLTNAGSGYETAPTVTISGGGGSSATATAALASTGSVKSVTLTAPGSGFTGQATVAFTGGSGSGAAATTVRDTAAAGSIASISVVNPGTGYTSAPTLVISGGGGSSGAATAVLSTAGKIASVSVSVPGSGFTGVPTVAFSGGGGSGAVAAAILSATGAVKSVTVTAAGTGYASAPTVAFTGGGGSGAGATASLGSSGPVVLLTLTHPGTYFVAPTVTISGDGTGATAIYHLSTGWPVLDEYHVDPTDKIIIHVQKKLIVPGSDLPSGFFDINAVDKWRSIQMVSSIDLHSLPIPDVYETTQHISLPDELLSVLPLWSTAKSQSSDANGIAQTGSTNVTAEVRGSIVVRKKSGFRGAAIAHVQRTFFFGPPPDASVPLPTVIRPASGTALIIGGSQSSGQAGSTFTPPLNVDGNPAKIGDLLPGSTVDDPIIYQGNYTAILKSANSGAVSTSIQAVDISDVMTAGYFTTSGYTYKNSVDAGDGALLSEAVATGAFSVDIPPSCPASLVPGSSILAEVSVEKWRFDMFVRTIIFVIVPPDCVIVGGGS